MNKVINLEEQAGESLLYTIADIHGNLAALKSALSAVESDAAGSQYFIIFLGDYIDRGPHSKEVLELIRDMDNTLALRGNHEQMMLDAIRFPSDAFHWLSNGGRQAMQSFNPKWDATTDSYRCGDFISQDLIEYVDSLPLMASWGNNVFVHGGITWDRPLEDQKNNVMLWVREQFLFARPSKDSPHVFHGHSPWHYDRDRSLYSDVRTNLDAYSVGTDVQMVARVNPVGGALYFLAASPKSQALADIPGDRVVAADGESLYVKINQETFDEI